MTAGSDRPLPDLYRSTLSDGLLEQLLADLSAHATIVAIQVRRRAGAAAAAPITLDRVRATLAEDGTSGVRVIYRFEGREWIDTLSPAPDGTQLVRIERA
jgi:hypothetical protein